VDWDEYLTKLSKRTGMFVPFPYFPSAVAAIEGFALGRGHGELEGLSSWLHGQGGRTSSLVWWAQVLIDAGVDAEDRSYFDAHGRANDEQVQAVEAACAVVRQFLARDR
jgi:hypothetical protein